MHTRGTVTTIIAVGASAQALAAGAKFCVGGPSSSVLVPDSSGKCRGNQQYRIPAGRYDTVVPRCVPFSVSLASADGRVDYASHDEA